MIEELDGKTIWLPAEAFQKEILPKPPDLVMSHVQIAVLTKKFEEMLAGYNGRAAMNKMKQEDQLVTEFVSFASYLLCIHPQSSARPRLSTITSLLWSKADLSALTKHAQSHTTPSPCSALCQVISCVCPCIWLTRSTRV